VFDDPDFIGRIGLSLSSKGLHGRKTGRVFSLTEQADLPIDCGWGGN
jgi:hypothetical protein